MDVVEHLLPAGGLPEPAPRTDFFWVSPKELSLDKLVTGALEAAFNEMVSGALTGRAGGTRT